MSRIGGHYAVTFHTEDGEQHHVSGVYREVVPNEKLVFTWAWRSTPERELLVTILIKPDGNGLAPDPDPRAVLRRARARPPPRGLDRLPRQARTFPRVTLKQVESDMAQATATQALRTTKSDCGTTASHGTFCWNELMTRDVERAKQFYRDTIGWSFEPMTMPGWRHLLVRHAGRKAGRRPVLADRPGVRRRAGELDVLSRCRRRGSARRQGRQGRAPS